jgi:hypothetical protein
MLSIIQFELTAFVPGKTLACKLFAYRFTRRALMPKVDK